MEIVDGVLVPLDGLMHRQYHADGGFKVPSVNCSVLVGRVSGATITLPDPKESHGLFVAVIMMYQGSATSPSAIVKTGPSTSIALDANARFTLVYCTGADWVEIIGYN